VWPVDPRLRKLPRGTSITTSSSGTVAAGRRPSGRVSWFTAKDYTEAGGGGALVAT
jgi:hypothetical protein